MIPVSVLCLVFFLNAINITGYKVLQVPNAFENSPRGPLIQVFNVLTCIVLWAEDSSQILT